MIHRFNKTKIVATIGPASMNKQMLEKLIRAGADVCRINSSHGDHEMMKTIITNVRELNDELNTHVAILFDLQGPKLRIGDVEKGDFLLKEDSTIVFTNKECIGNEEKVYIRYPDFHNDVETGEKILIDDGKLELVITDIIGEEVIARVTQGGILSSRKGVNLPNTSISLPSLTEKDRIDLQFALDNNVEWIGLSFVRKPEDVQELKSIISAAGKQCKVIAKIEKPEAVHNIDEIIRYSDGIMVARGDLGVELPFEMVPAIQKTIVKKCNKMAKPVIIATQMMESMITNFRPTRAEANDVGNAVFDGADALMLSAETSVGKFPDGTVSAMQKIISEVEQLNEIDSRWIIEPSHSYVTDRRMRLQIKFEDLTFNDGRSDIALSLFLHNSYDGSEGVRLFWGAIRNICSNGMVFGRVLGKYYRKHTQGFEIKNLREQVENTFDRIPAIKERIEILQNLSVGKPLLEKVEDGLGMRVMKYVKEQPKPPNAWILYNYLTWYISHIVDKRMRAAYQMQVSRLFEL